MAVGVGSNLFIADTWSHRIRRVDSTGIITTVAGNGTQGVSGDGVLGTNASLRAPFGVAVDVRGNLFIADTWNHRICRVESSGIITTVAGNGTQGFSGDGGLATSASLGAPYDVAVDTQGNLFVADTLNHRIRRVDSSGVITTLAGNDTQRFSAEAAPP